MRRLVLAEVEVVHLPGGNFRLDGGTMFGVVPKDLWQRESAPDAHNRIRLACNCLLLNIAGERILLDTGIGERFSVREREIYGIDQTQTLRSSLAAAGLKPTDITMVAFTHLHFDHAGTLGDFPVARFHLQEQEMQFATGPCMAHSYFNGAYTVEHVVDMVRQVYCGRVAFVAGDAEIAPGVTVHCIGGHTLGIQCVRVRTARGWVVLASDASHMYDNFQEMAPYPIVSDVRTMLHGFERLKALAESPRHIIPGHDPLVMERYPAANLSSGGVVVRLDVDPIS